MTEDPAGSGARARMCSAHDRLLERVDLALPVQPAVLDDPDLVRGALEIRDDVRREQHRASPILRDIEQLSQELPACDRIQARHGLVEHQQLRLMAERRQHRELLALADRKRRDAPIGRHVPLGDEAVDERAIPVRVKRRSDRELLLAVQHRKKLVLLRHEADLRLGRRRQTHGVFAEDCGGTLVGRAEAEQYLEQRRFAGAVLTEYTDDVAGLHVCGDVCERGLRAETLADIAHRDDRFRHCLPPTSRRSRPVIPSCQPRAGVQRARAR